MIKSNNSDPHIHATNEQLTPAHELLNTSVHEVIDKDLIITPFSPEQTGYKWDAESILDIESPDIENFEDNLITHFDLRAVENPESFGGEEKMHTQKLELSETKRNNNKK